MAPTKPVPFPFGPQLRTIVSMDGAARPLKLFILYDFYFYLPSAKKPMNSFYGYILMFYNDFIPLDVSNPSSFFDSPTHIKDDDEID